MNKHLRGVSFYIVLIVILVIAVQVLGRPAEQPEKLTFSDFYQKLNTQQIKEVTLVGDYSITGKLKDSDKNFTSYMPFAVNSETLSDKLLEQSEQGNIVLNGEPTPQRPWIIDLLPAILSIGVLVVFWFFFMQSSQGGSGKAMNFGKSKAKLHSQSEGKPKITFADVAGLDEEKAELEEVVEFLKTPKKYMELGARIPKGILMVGPPGTGKTYLSKAVAGEAGVPFFSISGSDFVEMFVGVGASRVRDLFEQAKKSSPCIIFIDEIDAVGRKRGAGLGGGHDEREQTLNQLLVEMDGFGVNEGIIIIAATNRPDILDNALLRPGRFDRQIMVGRPDVRGREAILHVHAKNKPLAEDVNLGIIARSTPGFTPADLENLLNEAALLTARLNEKKIRMGTIQEAITKVIAGVAKKTRIVSEKERRLTAYHEAGHAIIAHVQESSDPVHQVTIIPRGMAGGFTMTLPEDDKYFVTKKELNGMIVELLGGRVAEELILDDISTGASNDLERIGKIAREMVSKYAMTDELSSMSYEDDSNEVFLGNDFSTKRSYSEEVAAKIDREIKVIVDAAHAEARRILIENMERLHYVADALLMYETLDRFSFQLAFDMQLDLNIPPEDLDKELARLAALAKQANKEIEHQVLDVSLTREDRRKIADDIIERTYEEEKHPHEEHTSEDAESKEPKATQEDDGASAEHSKPQTESEQKESDEDN